MLIVKTSLIPIYLCLCFLTQDGLKLGNFDLRLLLLIPSLRNAGKKFLTHRLLSLYSSYELFLYLSKRKCMPAYVHVPLCLF